MHAQATAAFSRETFKNETALNAAWVKTSESTGRSRSAALNLKDTEDAAYRAREELAATVKLRGLEREKQVRLINDLSAECNRLRASAAVTLGSHKSNR